MFGTRLQKFLKWPPEAGNVADAELATFHMLGSRQYRDDQGCGDGYKDCPAAVEPKRSITGSRQEKWLIDGFRRSDARWDTWPAGVLRPA